MNEDRAAAAARALDAREVLDMALQLRAMVELVTPDEFYWQEAHFDHDSKQGRELLFLMANLEWVRATSEIVDVSRSDAIETTIKIGIDLSQITHEAFRKRPERIWLPVAVLPPQTDWGRFEPDLFATVTDVGGTPLLTLPAADLRRRLSAAMAEIILNMAASHLPSLADGGQSPVTTREERLLLSAAIYRLLRHGAGLSQGGPAIEPLTIINAKRALLGYLDPYTKLLETRAVALSGGAEGAPREHQFAPELARRAIKVLQALAESVIVVVQMDYTNTPAALTVRVPTRKLTVSKSALIKPWTWTIRPSGRLGIDMLMPTADADRQIQINLPESVSLERPARRVKPALEQSARLEIAVQAPPPLQDLFTSVKQIFSAYDRRALPITLMQAFADLVQANAAPALYAMKHYEMQHYKMRRRNNGKPSSARPGGSADEPRGILTELAAELDEPDDAAIAGLRRRWQQFGMERLSLLRNTLVDQLNPQTVVARAGMIEDVSQRGAPQHATIYLDVTVDDRDYFSSARSSASMSLVLMLGVFAFLLGWHIVNRKLSPAPEVLAIVLTLFATIQAGRIERPDRSTLLGQLSAISNWVIAVSVLPPIILAVALAFQIGEETAIRWTVTSIAFQAALLVFMRVGPLTPNGRPRIGRRRSIATDRPDYTHFETLQSDYWRNTTADALMIGRKAYGYVIWQRADAGRTGVRTSPKLRPVLTWGEQSVPDESSSVLALLRSGTLSQAVTFVVFRGEPPSHWTGDAHVRSELDLDPERLAPMDTVTSTVDVFVGVDRDEMYKVTKHPLNVILKAAANKLIVLDAQLPVPAPVPGYERQWARIRVALRGSQDIRRLTDFLHTVYRAIARPENTGHVVAVRTSGIVRSQVITETAEGRAPLRQAEYEGLVLTSDLDVANGTATRDEPADARTWRVLAICADVRSNIESYMIQRLAQARPHARLVGLTYTLLHGTAVLLLLLHEPQTPDHYANPGQAAAWAGLRILVDEPLSRDQLGPVTPYPLLGVSFLGQDRPGVSLRMLDAISEALSEELPSLWQKDWSISYARLQVITGGVAVGRLTIRLHIPNHVIEDWSPARMDKISRKIEVLASRGTPTGGDVGSSVLQVHIYLVRKPLPG